MSLLVAPTGPGVRWDSGIHEGSDVSLYYDPMLAKLIVHADDRGAAIERMRRALSELTIVGVETSVPFHVRVMQEPDFRAGNITIRYLEEHPDLLDTQPSDVVAQTAALAAALLEHEQRQLRAVRRTVQAVSGQQSGWLERGWRDD